MRILTHRGSPTSDTVENSIPAISAALAAGAHGVELDLRLTADGVLAVCHDPDLRRLSGHVTVSSFDAGLVRAFRTMAPLHLRARTALLGDAGCLAPAVLRRAILEGHDEVHPHISDLLAHPETVAAAHAAGLTVAPWTVNAARDLWHCARLGVDAVITDVPQTALLAVAARRAAA